MFWNSKQQEPQEVNVQKVTATITLHDGEEITSVREGKILSVEHKWVDRADADSWRDRHIRDGLVCLENKDIPFERVKEITYKVEPHVVVV
jgi:hypothetical protein